MAEPIRKTVVHPISSSQSISTVDENPARQAFETLRLGFIALPVIAGLDKFFNFLVDWPKYLAPFVTQIVPARSFMMVVGVIEVAAGILVAVKPRIGAYVVGLWLLGIVGNLIVTGGYLDIALRDFGLALGAFALARLSKALSA